MYYIILRLIVFAELYRTVSYFVINIGYDDVISITFATTLFIRFVCNSSFTVLVKIPNFSRLRLNFGRQKGPMPQCSHDMREICVLQFI